MSTPFNPDDTTVEEREGPSLVHCKGCRDDHYNQPGNSPTGRCWGLDTAVFVSRIEIHRDAVPPYKNLSARPVPSCFRRPDFVQVDPKAIDPTTGYWKS